MQVPGRTFCRPAGPGAGDVAGLHRKRAGCRSPAEADFGTVSPAQRACSDGGAFHDAGPSRASGWTESDSALAQEPIRTVAEKLLAVRGMVQNGVESARSAEAAKPAVTPTPYKLPNDQTRFPP